MIRECYKVSLTRYKLSKTGWVGILAPWLSTLIAVWLWLSQLALWVYSWHLNKIILIISHAQWIIHIKNNT